MCANLGGASNFRRRHSSNPPEPVSPGAVRHSLRKVTKDRSPTNNKLDNNSQCIVLTVQHPSRYLPRSPQFISQTSRSWMSLVI